MRGVSLGGTEQWAIMRCQLPIQALQGCTLLEPPQGLPLGGLFRLPACMMHIQVSRLRDAGRASQAFHGMLDAPSAQFT